jgi:hypothetical protein
LGRRRYEAGDVVKLEAVFRHRANLTETRLIFVHLHDETALPVTARGKPRPISERSVDGSIRSRLDAEVTLPSTVVPGIYKLVRMSYRTGEGRLGHLEAEESLPESARISFEVFGEPEEVPELVDISFADS